MTAQIIDGKAIAQQVREEVAASVARRTAAGKSQPMLATVLIGDRPDSAAYVNSKQKACAELGMGSLSHHLPENATQAQVDELVRSLNADPLVNGILVQLPMPAHLDEERVLSLINIEKDVDGPDSLSKKIRCGSEQRRADASPLPFNPSGPALVPRGTTSSACRRGRSRSSGRFHEEHRG